MTMAKRKSNIRASYGVPFVRILETKRRFKGTALYFENNDRVKMTTALYLHLS